MTNKITYNEKTVYSTLKNLPSIREQVYFAPNFDALDVIIDMELLIKKAKLTEQQYTILQLYFIEGYTLHEISAKLGFSFQGVHNSINRSKVKIKRVLQKWGEI